MTTILKNEQIIIVAMANINIADAALILLTAIKEMLINAKRKKRQSTPSNCAEAGEILNVFLDLSSRLSDTNIQTLKTQYELLGHVDFRDLCSPSEKLALLSSTEAQVESAEFRLAGYKTETQLKINESFVEITDANSQLEVLGASTIDIEFTTKTINIAQSSAIDTTAAASTTTVTRAPSQTSITKTTSTQSINPSAAPTGPTCCSQKIVSGTQTLGLDGLYSFKREFDEEKDPHCMDGCIYKRDSGPDFDEYCFKATEKGAIVDEKCEAIQNEN